MLPNINLKILSIIFEITRQFSFSKQKFIIFYFSDKCWRQLEFNFHILSLTLVSTLGIYIVSLHHETLCCWVNSTIKLKVSIKWTKKSPLSWQWSVCNQCQSPTKTWCVEKLQIFTNSKVGLKLNFELQDLPRMFWNTLETTRKLTKWLKK